MKTSQFVIEYYQTPEGAKPVKEWLDSLDAKMKIQINKRITRMEKILGDYSPIKGHESLFEARVFKGPGYRLYFTIIDEKIVLLLFGGNKGSQKRDIEKASKMLEQYRRK